jgi:hypothetical protein
VVWLASGENARDSVAKSPLHIFRGGLRFSTIKYRRVFVCAVIHNHRRP